MIKFLLIIQLLNRIKQKLAFNQLGRKTKNISFVVERKDLIQEEMAKQLMTVKKLYLFDSGME